MEQNRHHHQNTSTGQPPGLHAAVPPQHGGNGTPFSFQSSAPPVQGGGGMPPGYPHQNGPSKGNGKQRPKRRYTSFIITILVLLIVAAAGVWGVSQLRENRVKAEIAPYDSVYADNIFINDISISGLTPEQALSKVSSEMLQRVNSWNLALTYEGWTYYTLNYPSLGIDYSQHQIYSFLNEAWALTHTGDVFQRQQALKDRSTSPYHAYTTKKEFDEAALDQILQQIAASIYREASDAVLVQFRPDDSNPFVIQAEQSGRAIDVEATKTRILEMAGAGVGGTFELQPIMSYPAVKKEDIEKTVALRGEAITSISKDSTENRINNIRVAFSKINGTILEPGRKFSFNDVVGPRTLKTGFFEAYEQVSGNLVIGVGGGICQASTTLYQAALLSNLQILDRDIHSKPVMYTEKGQDATVFLSRDHEIDFVFKNTTPGRIYITASVMKGSSSKNLISKIRFYGEALEEGTVYRLHSVEDEVLKSEEIVYIPDKYQQYTVYEDETKLAQKAVDGYLVSTYLRKYVNGNLLEEKLVSRDRYNPTPAQYWQGTTKR